MVEVPLPATRYLTVGFNTTFHCRAKGYPPPKYKWLNRILSEIDITNPRFTLNGEYFTISDIQQSDQGEYTCIASNVKAFKVNATATIKEVYGRFPQTAPQSRSKSLQSLWSAARTKNVLPRL